MQKKELVFRRQAQSQSGCPLLLEYYRLEQTVRGGVEYGAAIRCICADGREETALPAITVRRERIDRLLALLADGTVTPATLRDVTDDWL